MPELVFLTERQPLLLKAATWLADQADPGLFLDLSHCQVVLPTSGAARRLKPELARLAVERGSDLLPPHLTTPIGLLAEEKGVASRADALLAWTEVIARASVDRYPLLLEAFPDHRQAVFPIAHSLMEVCSLLAEGEFTPASPEIAAHTPPHEEERWAEVADLYSRYLKSLEKAGLVDPNQSRLRVARSGRATPGIRHIVVAGVSDLNCLVQRYLERLKSVKLTILVDAPDCEDATFDAFGRPAASEWPQRNLPLIMDRITVAADPVSEAEVVAKELGQGGGAGVVIAVPETIPVQTRALRKIGRPAYNPAGRSLASFESATVLLQWLAFCQGRRLSDLRFLLEHPIFLEALMRQTSLNPSALLEALDALRTSLLVETLPDALAFLRGDSELVLRLLGPKILAFAVDDLLRQFDVAESLDLLPSFLGHLYEHAELPTDSPEANALAEISRLLRAVLHSPVAGSAHRERAFREELEAASIYVPRQPDEVELHGWLEAAWLPNPELIISGCVEGALPAHSSGHAFLPDSMRLKLGLPHQSERLARDTYLLHCLLAERAPGSVLLTLSRKGMDEEPAKPSRLLFRCPDEALAERAEKLFGPPLSLRQVHARQPAWLLEIPRVAPPETLRVTAFGEYLRCPFRFYLRHVLRMEIGEGTKDEMDARDYGIVLHKVVENFAEHPELRESRSAREIENFVLAQLDDVLVDLFGKNLLLPVRVQRESLAARLRQFARLQAEQRREGWRLEGAEYRFLRDDTIVLHGMPITASLDRVEVNEFTGQRRVLDYKTYSKPKTPAQTHLDKREGPHEFEWSALVFEGKPHRWRELQLPLYRALAEYRWPGEPHAPWVGYMLLPERLEDSGLEEFPLGEIEYQSALLCAEGVIENIRRGIFWPPREVEFDDFAEIFAGEDPTHLMSESSIAFLRGQ